MAIVKEERITILEFFERIHGCDGGSVSYRASDSDRGLSEEEDDGDEGSSTESQRSSSHDDDDDFISEDEDLAENRQIAQHSGLEALLSNFYLPL